MQKDLLYYMIHYSALGYNIYLSNLYGQNSVKMTKRYSHKRKAPIYCEQIQEHEQLRDTEKLAALLDFMYTDIKNQERTGKYNPENE